MYHSVDHNRGIHFRAMSLSPTSTQSSSDEGDGGNGSKGSEDELELGVDFHLAMPAAGDRLAIGNGGSSSDEEDLMQQVHAAYRKANPLAPTRPPAPVAPSFLVYGQCSSCLRHCAPGEARFCGECGSATLCPQCDVNVHAESAGYNRYLHYRQALQPPLQQQMLHGELQLMREEAFIDHCESEDERADEREKEDEATDEEQSTTNQLLLMPADYAAAEEEEAKSNEQSLIQWTQKRQEVAIRSIATMPETFHHPALIGDPYAPQALSARSVATAVPAATTGRLRKGFLYRPASARRASIPGAPISGAFSGAASAIHQMRPIRPLSARSSSRGSSRPVSARSWNGGATSGISVPVPPDTIASTLAAASSIAAIAAAGSSPARSASSTPRQPQYRQLHQLSMVRPLLAPTTSAMHAGGGAWGEKTTSPVLAQLHQSISKLKTQLTALQAQRQDAQVALQRRQAARASLVREAFQLKRMGQAIVKQNPRAETRKKEATATAMVTAATKVMQEISNDTSIGPTAASAPVSARRPRPPSARPTPPTTSDLRAASRLAEEISQAEAEAATLNAEIVTLRTCLAQHLPDASAAARTTSTEVDSLASLRSQHARATAAAVSQQSSLELSRFTRAQLLADLHAAAGDLAHALEARVRATQQNQQRTDLLQEESNCMQQQYYDIQKQLDVFVHAIGQQASTHSSHHQQMIPPPQPPSVPRPLTALRN